MNPEKKQALMKALRYWMASFAVVAGFLYYKSSASMGAILVAGVLTFIITVGRVWIGSNTPRS